MSKTSSFGARRIRWKRMIDRHFKVLDEIDDSMERQYFNMAIEIRHTYLVPDNFNEVMDYQEMTTFKGDELPSVWVEIVTTFHSSQNRLRTQSLATYSCDYYNLLLPGDGVAEVADSGK